MDDNELNSLSKEINNSLYAQNKASQAAKELGYATGNNANKLIFEVRQEMLGTNEDISFVHTGTEKLKDVLSDENDKSSVIQTGIEKAEDTIVTSVDDISNDTESINTLVKQGVNTAIEQSEEVAEESVGKISKIATKVQKVAHGATKTGKFVHKGTGKVLKLAHNNIPVSDGNGNIDSVDATKNQIKTVGKFAGRNLVGKPTKKVVGKVNKKIGKKVASGATKRLAKLEAKLTAKAAQISSKVLAKVATFVIKIVIKIIMTIIEAICAFLPVAIVVLILIIIVVVCLTVFGGGLNNDELQTYGDYMNTVQSEFQSETLEYYNEGYKVDGTYNGIAVINWRAALSVLQALEPNIDASDEVIDVLRQMRSDGVMYSITTETTEEYVYKTETKTVVDENGDTKQETVEYTTTIKYVVYVGTLDDYKNWIENNTSYIANFYQTRGLTYGSTTTNFLTSDLSENIDTLYNSDEFDVLLKDAGVSMSYGDIADGTIYDTGENHGVLAYPTTYHNLSADFPTYPSGKSHTGIDFPCPSGTPVCACADGTVIVTKQLNYSYGYYVVIQHNINGNTIYTLYAHNSVLKVSQGQQVVKGQCIALSGSTGNSTGPHCHLSVLTSWSPQHYVDPKSYL